MRRMYSDGQVVKVVNKAIEEGEIQAGGLPEIEAGDAGKALVVNQTETGAEWAEVGAPDNVLVLPESAPAAQQLVGINTSGEQNALGLSEGLVIDNNNISLKRLVLDFNGNTTYQLTEAIATKINNKDYDEILILNYQNIIDKNRLLFTLNSDVSAKFNGLMNSLHASTGYNRYHLNGSFIMPNNAASSSSDFYEAASGIHKTFISYEIYLKINSSFILSLDYTSGSSLNNDYYNLRKHIVLTTTTQTGTLDYPYWNQTKIEKFDSYSEPKALFDIVIPLIDNIDSSTPYNIYMRFASSSVATGNKYAYAYGERVEDTGITYKYIMKIATNKSYTITRIAA